MPTKKKSSTKKPPAAAAAVVQLPTSPAALLRAKIAEGLKKKFGEGSAVDLGAPESEALAEVKEVIPTRIDVIDRRVLGIGGLPVGRVVEVAGPPGGAKTTLGWSVVAQVQREGGVAAWVDAEKAISRDRCEKMGARWGEVLLSQPETTDEALEQIRMTLDILDPAVGPNIIVWDSVPALQSRREVKKGKPMVADLAGLLTNKLKGCGRLLVEKRCLLFCINQVRAKVSFMSKGGVRTPGGFYFEHNASVRLMLWPHAKVKAGSRVVGREIGVSALKNRFADPFQDVEVRLFFQKGWDDRWSTINLAKDEGLIGAKKREGKRTHIAALEALKWPITVDVGPESPAEEEEEELVVEPLEDDVDDEDRDPDDDDEGDDE